MIVSDVFQRAYVKESKSRILEDLAKVADKNKDCAAFMTTLVSDDGNALYDRENTFEVLKYTPEESIHSAEEESRRTLEFTCALLIDKAARGSTMFTTDENRLAAKKYPLLIRYDRKKNLTEDLFTKGMLTQSIEKYKAVADGPDDLYSAIASVRIAELLIDYCPDGFDNHGIQDTVNRTASKTYRKVLGRFIDGIQLHNQSHKLHQVIESYLRKAEDLIIGFEDTVPDDIQEALFRAIDDARIDYQELSVHPQIRKKWKHQPKDITADLVTAPSNVKVQRDTVCHKALQ